MPTTFNNFRFSLHQIFLHCKLAALLFICLFIYPAKSISQNNTEFTRATPLDITINNVLEMGVRTDSSIWLLTTSGPQNGGIYWWNYSADGQLVSVKPIAGGSPVTFRTTFTDDRYFSYGLISQCDVSPEPLIAAFDTSGTALWDFTYPELGFGYEEFENPIFALPLSDGSVWIFCESHFPFRINSAGSQIDSATTPEPVYHDYYRITDDRFIVWGKPGVAIYNADITQKTTSLADHEILDLTPMSNGQFAALSKDSLWVLSEDLEIVHHTSNISSSTIGVEANGAYLYLMYSSSGYSLIRKLDFNLNEIQTDIVTSTTGLIPKKFVCHNNLLYYAGNNGASVIGFHGGPINTPGYTPGNDAGVIGLLAPFPITITNKYELKNVSVIIRNNGTDTIEQVRVNSILSSFSFICLQQTDFSKKITSLMIPPGAQDTILLPDLSWNAPFMPGATYKICFWTTVPNDSIDADASNDRLCYDFPIPSGTGEVFTEQKLSINPNPSAGCTVIGLPEEMRLSVNVQLFDHTGRVVQRFHNDGDANISVSKSVLVPGMYVVKITDEAGRVAIGKIIFE